METRICKCCNIEKNINEFDRKKDYYLHYCKECRRTKRKQYYKKHREEEIKRTKLYQEKNKEKLKEKSKLYREKNKERIKEYNKKWEQKNKIKRKKYDNELKKQKKDNDKVYYLKCKIRSMLNNSFKRKKYSKKSKSQQILGCDWDFFINYLFQTFLNNYGYEWNGYEKVHIDHIIPLSTAKTEKEVMKLCHYSNLQLLKAKDNLEKHNKLDWKLKK